MDKNGQKWTCHTPRVGIRPWNLEMTLKNAKVPKNLENRVFWPTNLEMRTKPWIFFEDLENRSSQIIPKHYTLARCISDWIWNYTYLEIIPKMTLKTAKKAEKTLKNSEIKPWNLEKKTKPWIPTLGFLRLWKFPWRQRSYTDCEQLKIYV